jgi:hypothetical protein
MSTHQVTRLSISIDQPYEQFRTRLHAAVPQFNAKRLNEFVERKASWDEVLADAAATAPFGFFLYWQLDIDPSMELNGNTAKCCEYLMGNHTIAERMYRITPMSMLYVPLRFVLYKLLDGPTTLVIEQPSSVLASIKDPQVDAVAAELDRKLAALFLHLGVAVPSELAMAIAP